MILQFLSFPFSISVHDFCRSEARYRIIVAFLRLKYVLVEIGIIFLLIKILFTLVILQKSMKESVDNLKIQHILLNWNNIFLTGICNFKSVIALQTPSLYRLQGSPCVVILPCKDPVRDCSVWSKKFQYCHNLVKQNVSFYRPI